MQRVRKYLELAQLLRERATEQPEGSLASQQVRLAQLLERLASERKKNPVAA